MKLYKYRDMHGLMAFEFPAHEREKIVKREEEIQEGLLQTIYIQYWYTERPLDEKTVRDLELFPIEE